MTVTTAATKTIIATVALTTLGLVAAGTASAHTSNMYTYVVFDENVEQAGFATYGKTDGVTTLLPTTFVPTQVNVSGIEVNGEKGTALIGADVRTWNHTSGDIESSVATFVSVAGAFSANLNFFTGLDTLNDGTTVTLLGYDVQATDGGSFTDHYAIASVDAVTGALVPIVDLTEILKVEGVPTYDFNSLATDPRTGITYVFLEDDPGSCYFLAVDVAAQSIGTVTEFDGVYFVEGLIEGADFDADGTLFFNYENDDGEGDLELLMLTAAPSAWATAEPTYISSAPAELGDVFIAARALTIEQPALAATGSELPIAAIVFLGSFAVLAGGVTVAIARRRSGSVV